MRYTCVDAFSGAGGMGLGLQKAGYEILLSFDIDPHCIRTQQMNPQYFSHPAYQVGIEKMLDGGLLETARIAKGELFLLAGGPPCQGFSIQRIGADEDGRNNLVTQYMQLVREVMPRYFLMENVPGIEGKRGKSILEEALQFVIDAGYWIYRQPLDAQEFGVPQRRRRVFVVGERADGELPLFKFPNPSETRKTVRDTIGHLPSPPLDGSDHEDIPHHRRDRISDTNKQRLAALLPGQGREHLPAELLAECHKVDSAIIGHRNVYGRMAWDEVSPTITARFDSFTRGLFGHPEDLRSISLREGALLQTFPADFMFSGGKVDIARQIGNAVPPVLAQAVGQSIIRHCIQRKAS